MTRPLITTLRDCVPLRPLLRSEALRIAELQASKFLALVGQSEAPVSLSIITELPRVRVAVLRPFPVSGATKWTDGVWMIVLNGREPQTRQRFSLAHEFKHILDDRFVDLIYRSIPAGPERDQFRERVCDYFAGCLLMPRPWVKRYYGQGIQRPNDLARLFDVSEAAIETRLAQIGLIGPRPRCDRSSIGQALWDHSRAGNPHMRSYLRLPDPAYLIGAPA